MGGACGTSNKNPVKQPMLQPNDPRNRDPNGPSASEDFDSFDALSQPSQYQSLKNNPQQQQQNRGGPQQMQQSMAGGTGQQVPNRMDPRQNQYAISNQGNTSEFYDDGYSQEQSEQLQNQPLNNKPNANLQHLNHPSNYADSQYGEEEEYDINNPQDSPREANRVQHIDEMSDSAVKQPVSQPLKVNTTGGPQQQQQNPIQNSNLPQNQQPNSNANQIPPHLQHYNPMQNSTQPMNQVQGGNPAQNPYLQHYDPTKQPTNQAQGGNPAQNQYLQHYDPMKNSTQPTNQVQGGNPLQNQYLQHYDPTKNSTQPTNQAQGGNPTQNQYLQHYDPMKNSTQPTNQAQGGNPLQNPYLQNYDPTKQQANQAQGGNTDTNKIPASLQNYNPMQNYNQAQNPNQQINQAQGGNADPNKIPTHLQNYNPLQNQESNPSMGESNQSKYNPLIRDTQASDPLENQQNNTQQQPSSPQKQGGMLPNQVTDSPIGNNQNTSVNTNMNPSNNPQRNPTDNPYLRGFNPMSHDNDPTSQPQQSTPQESSLRKDIPIKDNYIDSNSSQVDPFAYNPNTGVQKTRQDNVEFQPFETAQDSNDKYAHGDQYDPANEVGTTAKRQNNSGTFRSSKEYNPYDGMKENDSYIPKPLHVRPEESKSNIYPFYEVGDEDSKPLGQKPDRPLFRPGENFQESPVQHSRKLDPTSMQNRTSAMASLPKMQNRGTPTSYTPVRYDFGRDAREQPKDINWNQSANWEPIVIRKDENKRFPKQDQTLFDSFDKNTRDGFDMGVAEEQKDLMPPIYKIEQAKQEFLQEVDALEKDPHYMRVNVAFLHDGPDGIGRRLYGFHVRRQIGTVLDIKHAIRQDFGYDFKQQRIYRNFKELPNDIIIENIKDWVKGESLIFVPHGKPANAPSVHLRHKLNEISIVDVNQSNCSNITKEEFENFSTDDNLVWPPYRDWVRETEELFEKIRYYRKLVDNNTATIETIEMSHLMNLESELKKLIDDFEFAAAKCVHMIVQWRTDPVFLDNLHGKGGNKYVAGGMVIRECKNWIYCAENVGEGDLAYKLADNELRAQNLLRGLYSGVYVPLNCIVDYFGVRYYAEALCPISQKTLIYGSNTEALQILNDKDAENLAFTLAEKFNLKKHVVYERVEKIGKNIVTPYDLEIHRTEDGIFYILNSCRLMASDYFEVEDRLEGSMRLFRPELAMKHNDGKLDPDYELVTWVNPVRCEECNKFILEFEYFYYEKRNIDKKATLLKQYYCCKSCHDLLAPMERLKVPSNRVVHKTMAEKNRFTRYINVSTGEETFEFPGHKIPLNPDCHPNFSEFSKPEDIAFLDHEYRADREETKRLAKQLKGNMIDALLKDFKTFTEEPRTSDELTEVMHKRGINMRFLGRIATDADHNYHRELAVREILSRAMKVLIRDGLSFLKDEPNGFTVDDVKKCVLYYYNELLSKYKSESSDGIWESLSELIKKKFGIVLEKDVLQRVNMIALLLSLSKKLGVKLARIKGFDFESQKPFSAEDLIAVVPKVKIKNNYMFSVEIALKRARLKDMQGTRSKWFMIGGPERAEATELYRQAAIMAEQIFGLESRETAEVHKEFAKHLQSRHCEKGRPEYSLWNRAANIPEDEFSADAKYYFNSAIAALQSIANEYEPGIADCMVALACLHKEKKIIVENNVTELTDPEEVYKYLRLAIEITEFCVGVDHPESAELYTKLALAYKEKGKMAEAYPWIKKAYCIFDRIFGIHDEITIKTYDYVVLTGIFFDPNIDKIPIEDMRMYLEEQEFDVRKALTRI